MRSFPGVHVAIFKRRTLVSSDAMLRRILQRRVSDSDVIRQTIGINMNTALIFFNRVVGNAIGALKR